MEPELSFWGTGLFHSASFCGHSFQAIVRISSYSLSITEQCPCKLCRSLLSLIKGYLGPLQLAAIANKAARHTCAQALV